MFKAISAVVFAAGIVQVTGVAPDFTRSGEVSVPQRGLKGDRLKIHPPGPACSQAAWPHYEAHCVRGGTQPGTQPRDVRIVTTDRPPAKQSAAALAN